MFLRNQFFFLKSDNSMKDLCITREQSTGIHDVSMIKGLQCITGQFQTRSAIGKFSDVRESIQQSKRMG